MIKQSAFEDEQKLVDFVNKESVKVISIVLNKSKYVLFYGKKEKKE